MAVERSTQEARPGVTGTGTQVMDTSATLTTPTINGGTITGATIVGAIGGSLLKRCTTQFDAVTGTTGTTLTNVVGLTGFSLIAAGVYAFEINLGTVATTNSGLKIGLAYTTLTATSIEYQAIAASAAAVVVSRGTTSTTGMSIIASTTAVLCARITGTLVVNAAGTVAVQAAQNAAHADTTSVFVGSWAKFSRIA